VTDVHISLYVRERKDRLASFRIDAVFTALYLVGVGWAMFFAAPVTVVGYIICMVLGLMTSRRAWKRFVEADERLLDAQRREAAR